MMLVRKRQKQIERAATGKRRRRALQFVSKKRNRNKRIVIELVSAADVDRLVAQDNSLRSDLEEIRKEVKRIDENRSKDNYEYRTIIGALRRKLNE